MPDPARILLIRCGALGDMVQLSAVVGALADHHGVPVDVLSSGGFSAACLTGMPGLGEQFSVKHRRRPGWLAPDVRRLAATLAARSYAHVYPFDRVPVVERALAKAGAVVHNTEMPTTSIHALDSYREQLVAVGVQAPTLIHQRVVATAPERAAAQALLVKHGLAGKRAIVIQAGNKRTLHFFARFRPGRDLKAWPTAHWVGAATALATAHPDAAIVFAGAPPEWDLAEDIRQQLPEEIRQRSANLARDLPVRTLAGLLAEALGCLSVDTGPAHLAAALGCPLVVLFGPADPLAMVPRGPGPVAMVRSGVACSPCYGTMRRRTCRENICMRQISVAQVAQAWAGLGLIPTV